MAADTDALAALPLLAIIRFREGGGVLDAVEAVVRGGIEIVEVTLDTPGALEAVERVAESGRSVGAGTVVTGEEVRAAAAAGARFVVSPGFVPDVVNVAHSLGVEPIPGVYTATEILAAGAAGARAMKLFPASSGGPAYLRALRGPFPSTALVATGGIGVAEVGEYLDAGATAVALGSQLVGRSAPRSDAELESISARAAQAVEAARNGRSGSGAALAALLGAHPLEAVPR
jgi:2-dehydro-3-deoxyphosphogluconate aldolase/(4S)-4-hydroxy-2-oxoglutarate aldolase